MPNIRSTASRMEPIAVDAALMGVLVDDGYATVDATRKQALRQALVAFHRELWEQTAPAVREALA
jgi:hypothetical protein